MKILSWNVNGLRAIYKRGFLKWLEEIGADIVCLQEIKIKEEQLTSNLANPNGYHSYFSFASRKGYSGVAAYSKKKPLSIGREIGLKRFEEEGRVLILKFTDFTLLNLYLLHGGRKKENLLYKLEVYDYLLDFLKEVKNEKLILIGDFNVAHKEIDLTRPKQNRNNIMFTPKERKQIDKLLKLGFMDSFRKFHKKGGHYTWWPYAYKAKERNLGWRIDYAFVSKSLAPKLKNAFILPNVPGSDHCPIGIEI